MEGYYSSDDDVAWGPYTLREAKRDIREGLPSKTDRRHTYSGYLDRAGDNAKLVVQKNLKLVNNNLLKEMDGKVYTSDTSSSDYFTPNETFKSGPSSVDVFLDKMKKAIEVPITNKTHATVTNDPDTDAIEIETDSLEEISPMQQNFTGRNRQDQSMLNFLKLANIRSEKISMFGNIEPTLVENTIIISSDEEEVDILIVKQEKDSNSYMLDNTCYNTSSEVEMLEMDDTSDTNASINMTNLDNSMLCSFSDDNKLEGTDEYEIAPCKDVCNNSNIPKVQVDSDTFITNYHSQINKSSESSFNSNKLCKEQTDSYEQYYKTSSEYNLPSSSVKKSSHLDNKAKEDEEIAFSSLESVNEKPDIDYIIKRLSKDLTIEDSVSTSSICDSDFNEMKNIKVETDTVSENHHLPELVISSYDTSSTSRDSSHVFNDTLEEIEMALKYGLDYKMPVDFPNSPSLETSGSSNHGSYRKSESFSDVVPLTDPSPKSKGGPKYHTVESCIPRLKDKPKKPAETHIIKTTKQETPLTGNFKVPHILPKQKMTPNKSPSTQKFKDIMSPVGIYIKQSPAPFLKRNVMPRNMSNKSATKTPEAIPLKNIENASLPQVVYKPSRKKIVYTEKEVVLPKSIKKMICEPEIIKNEARIAKKVKDISVGTELEMFEEDLTYVSIDENALDMTGDISILSKKQGFIK